MANTVDQQPHQHDAATRRAQNATRVNGLLAALAIAAAATTAGAQDCASQWSDRFPVGLDGDIEEMHAWNDGPDGRRLLVCGNLRSIEGVAGRSVMAFDGAHWAAMDTGLPNEDDIAYTFTSVDLDGDGFSEAYLGGNLGALGGVARWDGVTWVAVGPLAMQDNDRVEALATVDFGDGPRLFAGGGDMVMDDGTVTRLAVYDGSRWHSIGPAVSNYVTRLLAGFDPVSGAPMLYIVSLDPSGPIHGISQWDGQALQTVGGGVTGGAVYDLCMWQHDGAARLVIAGGFTGAGASAITGIAAWNGSNWSPLARTVTVETLSNRGGIAAYDDGLGTGPALFVNSIVRTINGMQATGMFRFDGSAWSVVGSKATNADLRNSKVAVFDRGGGDRLWIGSEPIQSWDGESWEIRNTGIAGVTTAGLASNEVQVRCMRRFDDGSGAGERLFVGGSFTIAGPQWTGPVAAWDGNRWSKLGAGIDGLVHCMLDFDDGSGRALYAGRQLTNASAVLKWNGHAWSEVGTPTGAVYGMTVIPTRSGPQLAVCGSLGGIKRVMCWDGTTWSQLGGNFLGDPRTLCLFDDGTGYSLYVGGPFTSIGSVACNSIARWDGTAWQPIDVPFVGYGSATPYVWTMTEYTDQFGHRQLVVAGNFRSASGIGFVNIAAWDGHDWSAMGGGVNAPVYSLKVLHDGPNGQPNLYVGGSFLQAAGGLMAQGILRWNGVYWESIGNLGYEGNFTQTAFALEDYAVEGIDRLYVGGDFSKAGVHSAGKISAFAGCEGSLHPHAACAYEPLIAEVTGQLPVGSTLTDSNLSLLQGDQTLYRWHVGESIEPLPLPAGAFNPVAIDINESGGAAARMRLPGFVEEQSAINVNRQWHNVPAFANGWWTHVTAINNRNVAVGTYGFPNSGNYGPVGFIWKTSGVTTLTHPDTQRMQPVDINDDGTVIGTCYGPNGIEQFEWLDGVLTILQPPPGGSNPHVAKINNRGAIAGTVTLDGLRVPAVWDGENVTTLPLLDGYDSCRVNWINDRGEIAGCIWGDGLTRRAVIWRNGRIVDVNQMIPSNLVGAYAEAAAVNASGKILCLNRTALIPTVSSPADINADCTVDLTDLRIVIIEWGRSNSPADVNHDGTVNTDDLIVVISSWS